MKEDPKVYRENLGKAYRAYQSGSVSRRSYLKYLGVAIAGIAAGAGGFALYEASKPKPPAKKPYEGLHLNVIQYDQPAFHALMTLVPEFEEETGATVTCLPASWSEWIDKTTADFEAGTGAYDCIPAFYDYWRPYIEKRHSFDEFIENPDVCDEERLNLKDFVPRTVELMKYGGKIRALPWAACPHELAVRTSLTEEHGLKWDTMDKLVSNSIEMTKTLAPKMYGYAGCFVYIGAADHFFRWMTSWGAEHIKTISVEEGKFKAQANDPAVVEALEKFVEIFQGGSNPESIGWGYAEAQRAMGLGETVSTLWLSELGNMLEDPETSDIVGDSTYLDWPFGTMWGNYLGGCCFSINTDSEHRELAYKFIEWATWAETRRKMIAINPGASATSRISLLDDPELIKDFKWFPAHKKGLETAWLFPPVRAYTEQFYKMGDYVDKCLKGEMTPQAAMDTFQTELPGIIEAAGDTAV